MCSRTRPTQTGQDTGECALGYCLQHFNKTNVVQANFVAINGAVYACMYVMLYIVSTCTRHIHVYAGVVYRFPAVACQFIV